MLHIVLDVALTGVYALSRLIIRSVSLATLNIICKLAHQGHLYTFVRPIATQTGSPTFSSNNIRAGVYSKSP